MRPVIALLLILWASVALAAEDARVSFLVKQLSTAKDPRVRSQTVLLLGQTGSDSAVAPLCDSLKDRDALVRAATANALGDLRLVAANDCLKKSLNEPDATVRSEVEKALARRPVNVGALYVSIEPVQDKVGNLPESLVALADKLLREKLSSLSAAVAPPNEEKKAAAALVKARKLKAFMLRLQLLPGSTEKGLKVEMLVMSYPDQALKGSWNVKAAGGKPESLIKAMVPRVLDDAASDLEWKQ